MTIQPGASIRALVVHPVIGGLIDGASDRTLEACLREARGLAESIGLDVLDCRAVRIARPQPGTLIGSGKIAELAAEIAADAVDLLVVDGALSAVQQRNLERALKTKVIDRPGLILEIFGARARTKEGQLQVELAALTYARSRLVRSWTHLERQRGGLGFVGGPGETQLEADRRIIGDRIARLRRQLDRVKRTRALQRAARTKVPYPIIALVGYTNAGKSTLFNRLSGASVRAEDLLFATLDPTMRAIDLPSGRRVILADTVGFISELPTDLVAAFRATLEEVSLADLVLHVRDVSDPDTAAQRTDVENILADLGRPADDGARIEVLNKIDRLDRSERTALLNSARRGFDAVPISARTGQGCEALVSLIDRRLSATAHTRAFRVDLADGARLAWLYRHGDVLRREDADGVAKLVVSLDPADLARFQSRFGAPG